MLTGGGSGSGSDSDRSLFFTLFSHLFSPRAPNPTQPTHSLSSAFCFCGANNAACSSSTIFPIFVLFSFSISHFISPFSLAPVAAPARRLLRLRQCVSPRPTLRFSRAVESAPPQPRPNIPNCDRVMDRRPLHDPAPRKNDRESF